MASGRLGPTGAGRLPARHPAFEHRPLAEEAQFGQLGAEDSELPLVALQDRLTDTAQMKLWPDWRHHGFLTDLTGPAVDVDKFHRHHAVVELAIRDLKEGAGLEHVPSGNFHANSVWLQCAVLAHNLIRWTAILGNVRTDDQLIVARTIRTRLLAIPGRLVNRAGRVQVLFTQRTPHLDDHASQISFPGGRVEASDAGREDTALRETEEEIGLARDQRQHDQNIEKDWKL
ncbi:MAG: NUDIX domain-containing protein [Akkermansiaceae bacterium]|nr:NUDIX domain-containing protein [Akkermansiaceae bacterium]